MVVCGVSRSRSKLTLSSWTRVAVSRDGRDGTLTVDDEQDVVGRSPGPAMELNLPLTLYVGGLPPGGQETHPGVTAGFIGAIQRVSTSRLFCKICETIFCNIFISQVATCEIKMLQKISLQILQNIYNILSM